MSSLNNVSTIHKGSLRIGTSNITLPGSKRLFPEEFRDRPRLAYYASLFNSIEINSTFYKLPQAKTIERWSAEVPEGFQFCVKISKQITHAKDLQYNPADVVEFMRIVQFPIAQTGCLLVQFPGKITVNYFQQVASLLALLTKHNLTSHWRIVIEFRHLSWYNDTVYALLDKWKAALVLHDMPASQQLSVHNAAGFVYRRFHGVAGDYRGSYSLSALAAFGNEIEEWRQSGKDVYLYFNNTVGDAFENAKYFVPAR